PDSASDGDGRRDAWMRAVAFQGEVLEVEGEEVALVGDPHPAERQGLAGKLFAGLVEVVQVEVGVAQRMDELARLEARHLRHHQCEESVGGYVERHAQEDVSRALVELAAELSVRDEELEEAVAGRKRHIL